MRHPKLTRVTDPAPGQFYTLSYIGRKLGVCNRTAIRLVQNGIIPLPFYEDKFGNFQFTFAQMEAIIHTYRAYKAKRIQYHEIRGILDAKWNDTEWRGATWNENENENENDENKSLLSMPRETTGK